MKYYVVIALVLVAYDFWQGRGVRSEYRAIKALNRFCEKFPRHIVNNWSLREEREAFEEKVAGKVRANQVSMLFDLVWPVYILVYLYTGAWSLIYRLQEHNEKKSTDRHINIDHRSIREEEGRR